jgi:hypothetical protein
MNEETFAWFVGIDWGSEKHQVCVLDQQGTVVGERSFPHSGAGLAELGDWLLTVAGAATAVAVAIEVPHGPVVDSLIDRGFMVHSINPKQLDRLRDRFSVAGAKDDRRDGYVLADGVPLIGACFAASMLLTRGSSNCVRGRALPRNCGRNGCG